MPVEAPDLAPQKRKPGRPAKPKAGLMARVLKKEAERAKLKLGDRLTEYAFQDAGFGRMPIFRPMPTDAVSEVDNLLDGIMAGEETPASVALNGYAVRLPGMFLRDKNLAEQGFPDGIPISLVAICPMGASISDEDLLIVLLCLAVLGSADTPRGRVLDAASQFILAHTAEAQATDAHFRLNLEPHLADEIVAEFTSGPQNQAVVEGHRFVLRCKSETLLREWLGRTD